MSGDERTAYGEDSFSCVVAYIFNTDRIAFDEVRKTAGTRELVAVRCGGLEVRGEVSIYSLIENDPICRLAIAVTFVLPHNAMVATEAS